MTRSQSLTATCISPRKRSASERRLAAAARVARALALFRFPLGEPEDGAVGAATDRELADSRHLKRLAHHRAAQLLHAGDAGRDVFGGEVQEPGGDGHLRGLRHGPTLVTTFFAAAEQVVLHLVVERAFAPLPAHDL